MPWTAGETLAVVLVAIALCLWGAWLFLDWYTWRRVWQQRADRPQTAVAIDPQEYSGTWHEIARYPQPFQRGCRDTTATYTWLPDEQRFSVVNRCVVNGREKRANGEAVPTGLPGVLGVSFFPGVWGNYTVVKRTPTLSVVSNPSRSALWILSRSKHLAPGQWQSVKRWLRRHGYDTERLQACP